MQSMQMLVLKKKINEETVNKQFMQFFEQTQVLSGIPKHVITTLKSNWILKKYINFSN